MEASPALDQLLQEAIDAMTALTRAVVERSDFTQMTAAMQAAQDSAKALDDIKKLITETPGNMISADLGNTLRLGSDKKYLTKTTFEAANW